MRVVYELVSAFLRSLEWRVFAEHILDNRLELPSRAHYSILLDSSRQTVRILSTNCCLVVRGSCPPFFLVPTVLQSVCTVQLCRTCSVERKGGPRAQIGTRATGTTRGTDLHASVFGSSVERIFFCYFFGTRNI